MVLEFGNSLFKQRDTRESDGWLGSGKERAGGGIRLIDSGTITLDPTTIAYDVDFVDILIPAGTILTTDKIYILLEDRETSSRDTRYDISIRGTTTEGPVLGDKLLTKPSGGIGWQHITLAQGITTNHRILGENLGQTQNVFTSGTGFLDTNDLDIFTRTFIIRIGLRHELAADVDDVVGYTLSVSQVGT